MDKTQQAELLAKSRALFKAAPQFVRGVVGLEYLPSDGLPEVAFIGRSNVGKSSLINAVAGAKGLARTSNTPGRTQELNFFLLAEKCHIADLPGYGYARAPEKKVQAWTRLIHSYLRGRAELRRVFLLIDARLGIKPVDERIMKMLDTAAVSYQLVLTKADKLSAAAAARILEETQAVGQKHVACYPEVLLTSAAEKQGLDAVRIQFVRVLEGI